MERGQDQNPASCSDETSFTSFPKRCITWNGGQKPNRPKGGFVVLNYWERKEGVHRTAYELITGKKIPPKMTIDHLCKNTLCINPGHMEVVTAAENARRATTKDKPECGHEFSGVNSAGRRICKPCARAYNTNWRRNKYQTNAKFREMFNEMRRKW